MEEKILTLHPQGKKGTNILKRKYDLIAKEMVSLIKQKQPIQYQELAEIMDDKLSPTFDGKVIWYVVTVKLDLEARKVIRRVPKTSPHQVCMFDYKS